jgi:chromate reductase
MRVLALSGSLREGSYNTLLLGAAERLLPGDVELEQYPTRQLAAVPPYDADLEAEGQPGSVVDLKEAIAAADAIVIATPEYNSSIPGQLKNVLDWVSRPIRENPLRGKPVAVVGASTSAYGAIWAQAELRKVLGVLGARVVDAEVAIAHAAERFDERGELLDSQALEQLAQAVGNLVREAEVTAGLASPDRVAA